jgi:hypothetical protein
MIRLTTIALFSFSLLACGEGQTTSTTTPVATPTPSPDASPERSASEPLPASPSTPPDAGVVDTAIVAAPATEAALPADKVELTPSKKWPFVEWDAAQAYTFNLTKPGPGAKLHVFRRPQGWTEKPVPGKVLTKAQSKKALQLLGKTQGAMEVSKCPFPRHGIVFSVENVPVGSISVCFECGDILIWPAYNPDPKWEDKKYKRYRKLMRAYDRVFPSWKKLFAEDLGLATDWKSLPGSTP